MCEPFASERTSLGEGLVSLRAGSHAGEAVSLHELGGVLHIYVFMSYLQESVCACLHPERAMKRRVCVNVHT